MKRGFSATEERIIREWFREHPDLLPGERPTVEDAQEKAEEAEERAGKGKGKAGKKGLPPGLAKKEQLPPGLARQLEERGTLPPGLAKRELPPELTSRLPEPEPGQDRVVVDDDVVLVDEATGVVIDVLENVLGGGAN